MRRRADHGGWGGRGGFRDAAARIFSDNPLHWAVPLYTAFGITVRLHMIFIVFVLARLLYSALRSGDQIGVAFTAMGMAALFLLVLLHEYGHCIACRRVGGEATQIMLWPLGGLAECSPPETWRANLATTIGGPLVNVILAPLLIAALVLGGAGWDAVVFNPFSPGAAIAGLDSWWLIGAWWLHYFNLVLLAFNLLIPMYPMDGARIVHALLWARGDADWAKRIVVTVGLLTAIVLVVFGMVVAEPMLMGIGIFGGIVCWWERRLLTAPTELGAGIDLSAAYERPNDHVDPAPTAKETRRVRRRIDEQAELDRVLAKINAEGIGSLTRRERAVLQRETRRRRTAGD